MKAKHWTFLYMPSGEGAVRTVHVNRRLTYAPASLAGAFVIVVGMITLGYVRQSLVLRDVSQHEREVRALRAKISELEDAVSHYQLVMVENRALQERASLLAGLGPLESRAYAGVGLGGQEPFEEEPLSLTDEISRDRLKELRTQLDKLLREARFQRDSFEQVLHVLREDQELRDCTPSIRPIQGGYLSSRYGRRIDPFTGRPALHRGLDFSAPTGTPVVAPAAGRVKRAARGGSLGKLLEIDHGNGILTRYGHLNDFLVSKGETVTRGQVIARVGNSGRSTAPHLHYEVVREGRSENPWLYIVRD